MSRVNASNLWHIFDDVLESVLDIEGTEVVKTDVTLALMELTMGEMNINPKRPSQILTEWIAQEADSKDRCVLWQPLVGRREKKPDGVEFGLQ